MKNGEIGMLYIVKIRYCYDVHTYMPKINHFIKAEYYSGAK
jgi:hypothetical protein